MSQNKWVLIGGAALLGLGAIWYFSTKSSTSTGSSNAVNPNAQIGAGAYAQGTMPDIGNLLSYNNTVPGASIVPQATSTDPSAANYGVTGG